MSDLLLNADVRTFEVYTGITITRGMLVKYYAATKKITFTAGTADADIAVIGVALEAGAAGDFIKVAPLKYGALLFAQAALTDLAVGDWLYTAANGRLTDSNLSGTAVGWCEEASGTAGDLIQFTAMPQAPYNLT